VASARRAAAQAQPGPYALTKHEADWFTGAGAVEVAVSCGRY